MTKPVQEHISADGRKADTSGRTAKGGGPHLEDVPTTKQKRLLPYLEDLSAEQEAAVIETSPRSLVLAGAGSGKTRVLVARIAHHVVAEKVPPQRVLAFSFTRKACAEIAGRLEQMLRRVGSFGPLPQMAFTFHAFAYRLVRRYHRRLGFTSSPRVLAEDDMPGTMEAFARFLEQTTVAHPPGSPRELFRRMRPGVNEMPDPCFEELEQDFGQWKIRNSVLELSDQVPLAIQLLEGAVGERIRDFLKAVLVDEFQDIDGDQHRLFELLVGPRTRFTLCGDDDQAIYRWRGSRPDLIREYYQREEVSTHLLTTNYRCPERVLAVASSVIGKAQDRVDKRPVAHKLGGTKPRCVTGPGQAWHVARSLHKLHESGRPLESMAVLVRDHFDGRAIRSAIRKEGLRVTSNLERPGIRLLTFHGSKGLEFPVVFLPFLDHMRFPNRRLLTRHRQTLRGRCEESRVAEKRVRWIKGQRVGLIHGVRYAEGHRALAGSEDRVRDGDNAAPSDVYCRNSLAGSEDRVRDGDRMRGRGGRRVREGGEWSRYGFWWARAEKVVGTIRGQRWLISRSNALEQELHRCEEVAAWRPGLEAAWEALPIEELERLSEERRLCYVAMTRAREELWLFCESRRRCSEYLRDLPRGMISWVNGEKTFAPDRS